MSDSPEKSSFPELLAEVEKISREAQAVFGSLSPAQINWKPSAEAWSIGQCFDHLITSNRAYFPLMEKIASGEQRRTLWQRVPLLPTLFGRLLLGAVNPKSKRKLRAPKAFRPAASDIAPDIIDRFSIHQDEVLRLMQSTESCKPEKIIIPSAVSPLVIYSLLDGYRILVTHERRHFLQAERVMAAEGFPRG